MTDARPKRKRTALGGLLRVLWMSPLYALGFGVFFLLVQGAPWSRFPGYFLVAGIFSVFIMGSLWLVEFTVAPHVLVAPEGRDVAPWRYVAVFGATAVLASFLAAFVIDRTLMHGFLGPPRAMITFGLYTLLFCSLFMGIAMAMHFHDQALDRARSQEELNLARRIQRSFLLTQFPSMPRFEVHATNLSSKQVSGDFYDVVPAGEHGFLLAIADVSGKGVPAALLSSMLQASLRTQANHVTSVAEIMKNVNELVCRNSPTGQFATFFLARVEGSNLQLAFTNAGHNYPVVYRARGGRVELKSGGTVVGILETAAFEQDMVQLEPADRVVFYTDGVNEAMNAGGDMYGEERLHACVEALPAGFSAPQIVEAVLNDLRRFLAGVEAGDDVTVMALRVMPPVAGSAS